MSVSSLSNSSNCPAQLDIRAVFLFNRDVCMNSPHQIFAVSDHDYCVSMAHYDYIIVKDIPQSNKLLSEQEGAPQSREIDVLPPYPRLNRHTMKCLKCSAR